jgi:hypothetical protein
LIDGADEDWLELAMNRAASGIMVGDRLGELFGRGSLTIIPNTSQSQSIDILWGVAFSEREELVALRHFVDLNGTMSEF